VGRGSAFCPPRGRGGAGGAPDRIADHAAAALAAARLRALRVGLIGRPFPGMGDIACEPAHFAATLGGELARVPPAELIEAAAVADRAAVAGCAETYRAAFDVGPGISAEDLDAAAAMELGLRAIVETRRLGAFSYQFLDFGDDPRAETLPFVAACRLMAEGIGFAGEGDAIGAAGAFLLDALQPPATFAEMFSVDFAGNAVLLSHMGEANLAVARRDRRPALVARPAPIVPTRRRQIAPAFAFEPGRATWCALALGPAGRWRLVVAPVEILDFGPLPQLFSPHAKMAPAGGVREFLSAYNRAGGPHHGALAFGDARPRLRLAAAMTGCDYLEV
jgi:L-arabinose isomerase